MGGHVLIGKSGANVEVNEAATHPAWNVEDAMTGYIPRVRPGQK